MDVACIVESEATLRQRKQEDVFEREDHVMDNQSEHSDAKA